MRRDLFRAQYELEPRTVEKLPEELQSGDTLPDPTWDSPRAEYRAGSVQEGVSMTEPLYADTPLIKRNKRR